MDSLKLFPEHEEPPAKPARKGRGKAYATATIGSSAPLPASEVDPIVVERTVAEQEEEIKNVHVFSEAERVKKSTIVKAEEHANHYYARDPLKPEMALAGGADGMDLVRRFLIWRKPHSRGCSPGFVAGIPTRCLMGIAVR